MRNDKLKLAAALMAVPLFAGACSGEAGSNGDAAGYLDGERVELVVPASPGGGFDAAARLIAPFLESCSGARVVVLNEPGAGTLLATNNTFRGESDGTRIQIMHGVGIVGAELAGADGVQFESSEFTWIGRIDAEPHLMLTGPESRFDSFEDMVASDDPVRFVSVGDGSSESINPLVLAEIFDMPVELITGFEGGGEALPVVLRGDADGHVRTMTSSYEDMVATGAVPMLVIGSDEARSELVPDTPTIQEFAEVETEANAELLEAHLTLLEAGRALAGPPDMEPEALEAWRAAFDCAIDDPEFRQAVEDAGRPLQPLSGEETEELYAALSNAPEAYREILRRSI